MGNTKTNRASRRSREESVEAPVAFTVSDATRIIEARVDDIRSEVGQDIDSLVATHHLESGRLAEARERLEQSGIESEDMKELAGESIKKLVAKGENELAAKIAVEFDHDEDSLGDLLSDADFEDQISERIQHELVAEEVGTPLLRSSA